MKIRILMVVGRGEAIRNFFYSDVLKQLSTTCDVYLLTVPFSKETLSHFDYYCKQILSIEAVKESKLLLLLRETILFAHYRWLWTEKVKNKWEILAHNANTPLSRIRDILWKGWIKTLANRPILTLLDLMDKRLSIYLQPENKYKEIFQQIQPDLVFNTSHIHASLSELPVRIAHEMGIPTSVFIFSWDNLTSRGRITVPYDYYLVWNKQMLDQLNWIYPEVSKNKITITGTPQFDFHHKIDFLLSREELSCRLGLDPNRPFILYTTGMDRDFPEEVLFVEKIIQILKNGTLNPIPQLVVRTYIKGTSQELKDLAAQQLQDVFFPPILWSEEFLTPLFEDQEIYTSLLAHCCLGINPASTVSLELMMFNKPIINLGFDPPGSNLPYCYRWERHIQFDHFAQIAQSGATKIAYNLQELEEYIILEYNNPENNQKRRQSFLQDFFGNTLDGKSGERVAQVLLDIAKKNAKS